MKKCKECIFKKNLIFLENNYNKNIIDNEIFDEYILILKNNICMVCERN